MSTSSPTTSESSIFSIHDPPGYIKPSLQDMLLTDITADELFTVAEQLGVKHLSIATDFPGVFPVVGEIYGLNKRLMVNLVCCRRAKSAQSINIVFLVDTGSPVSYLSEKAMEILVGKSANHIPQQLPVMVHSHKVITCYLSPRDKHFADVNVLGMDFLAKNMLSIAIDYDANAFQLCEWKCDNDTRDVE
jgi:hypothetical protein